MRSVLVSGPADEATAVATALRRQGYDTFGFDLPTGLGTAATGAPPTGPVDCYVQLPPGADGPWAGSPTRALLRRVEAVALVTPLLALNATVLMVADDFDQRRREALRLMAEAALRDAGREEVDVVVLDDLVTSVA